MYNRNGLKYFMQITTYNNSNVDIILNQDIRKLIWKYAHYYPYIQCYICDKVLMNLNININIDNTYITENYSIINGLTSCNTCRLD